MIYAVSERFRRREAQNIVLGYKRELAEQPQMEHAEFLNDIGYFDFMIEAYWHDDLD